MQRNVAGRDGSARYAADWRGWEGTRKWAAIEDGMTIEASHHGNRVNLLFIVRHDHKPDAREARLPIVVAPR
jgi:Family of unknown function (DUF6228)